MPLLSTFGAASVRSFGGIGAVAAGAGLDVDEAFSTYLYEGTSASLTINNGIDLATEDGLTWIKCRNAAEDHFLFSSLQNGSGQTLFLKSNTSGAAVATNGVSQTATGFTVPVDGMVNQTGNDYASWTFRKAPKWFDIVTYTGTGVNRTISHDLGSTPGMIIVKRTDSTGDWACYHRGLNGGTNPATKFIRLNLTNAESGNAGYWNNTEPTDSVFTVGSNAATNSNGGTYVAYLFAHNNSDGEFGPDSDQDVIKCGSYTGTGSYSSPPTINLGFEPQWVMIKRADGTASWQIYDVMRGATDTATAYLRADQSAAEQNYTGGYVGFYPTSTGFSLSIDGTEGNASGGTYIYMAIRRGPLAEPTSGTDVFAIDTQSQSSAPFAISNFPVDFAIRKDVDGSGTDGFTRLLQGTGLFLNTDAAEGSDNVAQFDYNNGYLDNTTQDSTRYNWMWKRAPSYFDVVAYTGTGSATTVTHNLGVAPEMMWVKPRETGLASSDWWVFHKDLSTPADDSLVLNSTGGENTGNGALLWNSTMPTSSVFSLGSYNGINQSGRDFIAYLFATVAGVSKVGSYTGNGSTQNIDCGFSNGARFVLIKKTSDTGHWVLFDTARGIVAGNDARLKLNSTDAESSSYDDIDPLSSGFTLNNVPLCNYSGASYIFYAIA